MTVIVDGPGMRGSMYDMMIYRRPPPWQTLRLYRDSDVILTQLASRNRALRWSALTNRPLVLFLRTGGLDENLIPGRPDLVVFNAGWAQQASTWSGPSVVQRPSIDLERYRTTPGDAITLVNLTPHKGSGLFLELVRRCPDLKFIGIRGGWGDQLEVGHYPNLEILGPFDDMREVYRRTRILLMPSVNEAFGRVGLEAACSGIPAIASPLPGIREALADAALYADRDDLHAWESHIRSLMDPEVWEERSRRSLERAHHWISRDEVHDVVECVARLVDNGTSGQCTAPVPVAPTTGHR